MVPELREKFNSVFKQETYRAFLNELNSTTKYPADFPVAETPVFLSGELTSELQLACENIISQITTEEFKKKCDLRTLLADHMLIQRRDVIITPHNAFNSQEAIMRILDTTVENIKGYLEGKVTNEVSK